MEMAYLIDVWTIVCSHLFRNTCHHDVSMLDSVTDVLKQASLYNIIANTVNVVQHHSKHRECCTTS